MKRKSNKNNHAILSSIYTKYIRSKICPVKMPEKMIIDLKVIAQKQNKNVSELIRDDILSKYHFDLLSMNPKPERYWSGDVEDMPFDPEKF